MKISRYSPYINSVPFKSKYEIDASSAISRNQIFTLGMLMNNYWMTNPRGTFNQLKYNSVYGKVVINVKVDRDNIVESILKRNNIEYKKLDENF